jgi:hypothetical protein
MLRIPPRVAAIIDHNVSSLAPWHYKVTTHGISERIGDTYYAKLMMPFELLVP